MQFTQNPAISEARPGGKFSLYNGIIEGEYNELMPNKLLDMKWKFRDWEIYSHVVINFEASDDVS
jgi:activator of HSP90 ATPase